MSRLIIKNLPSYVTPVRLREHFDQKGGPGGTITDLKVALKPDGTSRRFGFLGYKTEKEAGAAQEWFNGTFLDSTRISVAVIDGVKGAPVARPNKRLRLDRSSDAAAHNTLVKSTVVTPPQKKIDPQFEQYLEVMQPRKKGPSWTDDSVQLQPTTKAISSKAVPAPSITSDVKTGSENLEGMSDLDWMRQRMSNNVELSDDMGEKVFEQSDDDDDMVHENAQSVIGTAKDPTKDTILQTSRLFVRNLAFSCSDTDLMELFKPFGDVSQIHIPVDSISKQPKGIAYVTFGVPACALAAYEALDKTSFQGRLLHILAAVDRKGKEQAEQDGKKTLKDERNLKRKANAKREFNWGMLYMNSDAVVSSIADRMGVTKADILNPESDNAAVKLALAETHVIQETKSYLESQGVILSSFSSRARSDTTILVKNIPYGTTADQITEMFGPHGKLSRILVPPAGTMAVVEFEHADEASKAFGAVAYRRLGNSVIYLEKGPLGMFQDNDPDDKRHPDSGPSTSTAFKPVMIAEQEGSASGEPNVVPGSTLFVKNLSFSTTTERLNQVFRNLPSFSFARVQTKPDQKRPGSDAPRLSMGYGFVGFKTTDAAKKALKGIQDYVLDGHALHVKFAGRGAEEDETKDTAVAKSRTTKMIVKNVPFEATKKDIRELFGAHGQLKSVRLPKKFNSRSRGFAFLDFVARQEAENAFAALRHTHLLGRHLVLEWAAETEQDLDLLRQKAGVGFGGGAEMPGRKRKLDLGVDDTEEADD